MEAVDLSGSVISYEGLDNLGEKLPPLRTKSSPES